MDDGLVLNGRRIDVRCVVGTLIKVQEMFMVTKYF